jgi:hypothetical protein
LKDGSTNPKDRKDRTMATLMQASRQWASRPDDERFTSLYDLADHCENARAHSKEVVVSSRKLEARPVDGDPFGLVVVGPNGAPVAPTHWAFGQLASRAAVKNPNARGVERAISAAEYLRALPGPLAADCINYGLKSREVEDVGVLLRNNGAGPTLAAMTGKGYGRVWNAVIARALANKFGDGLTGDFRVPGEFGKHVEVTKANTTLYASDRDLFVFLADEEHRIEVPNRRDGKAGSLARGFFVWNSEVGAATFGVGTFLFDFVCCNRIVWGAEGYQEIKIRHTASAPDRWIEQVYPAIQKYAESSTAGVRDVIEAARAKRLTGGLANENAVEDFLAKRFNRSQAKAISAAHLADEGRPIETLWDACVGVTALARSIQWQNERVELEREGGKLLSMAA